MSEERRTDSDDASDWFKVIAKAVVWIVGAMLVTYVLASMFYG